MFGEMRFAIFGKHHLLKPARSGIGLERKQTLHQRPRRGVCDRAGGPGRQARRRPGPSLGLGRGRRAAGLEAA